MTDGRNRGYIRERANAAILRSQGLPPDMIPAGKNWSARLRRMRPPYWRQNRGQVPVPGSSQLLDAAASDEPGTVPATEPYRQAEAAGRRNRVLSRDGVWPHPRLTLAAALLFLLALILGVVFLYIVSHPVGV